MLIAPAVGGRGDGGQRCLDSSEGGFKGSVKVFLLVLNKSAHKLMNFRLWLTKKNQAQNVRSVEPGVVLEGLLRARLRVEHTYYRMTDDILTFVQIETVGWVLCTVGEQEQLIMNF